MSVARGAIRAVDTNDWTRRNFARWMFEDYPRAALFTPRRWHRKLFHLCRDLLGVLSSMIMV